MIMANLAKSWLTMVPLSRSWQIMIHGTLGKIMINLGILAKIMVSLCTILHVHGILAKTMVRSWQDLGKASKELAMDLDKDTMASNTGNVFPTGSTVKIYLK